MQHSSWRQYIYGVIAAEVSAISRYADLLIQWCPRSDDSRLLLQKIDCNEKVESDRLQFVAERCLKKEERHQISDGNSPSSKEVTGNDTRAVILMNGNLNYDYNIEETFSGLFQVLNRFSRLIVICYNPYFRQLYRIASQLGLRSGPEPDTFVTTTDLTNIAKLSGFEIVRVRPSVFCPWRIFGLGDLINRLFAAVPVLNLLSLVTIIVLRPIKRETSSPSLSVIIPARNERGNIENALKRMPRFRDAKTEIIFVEGHSRDQTWEEIQRIQQLYANDFTILAFQQTGKGKADAVRLGFSKASGELLTILDADLTMPPELLVKFYEAYCGGHADFINGSRLVYPMEGQAMRPLNHLGNVFFAKALSFVLGNRLGDSLCGTKLITKTDYSRCTAWRRDFGDFDPFGDYELLFPASELGLGIIDIPIRYRDRTYGSTNISRWRHGMMLLRMTLIGLFRIKLGKV